MLTSITSHKYFIRYLSLCNKASKKSVNDFIFKKIWLLLFAVLPKHTYNLCSNIQMQFYNNFIVKINKLVQVNSRICIEIQGAKNSPENTEKEKLWRG